MSPETRPSRAIPERNAMQIDSFSTLNMLGPLDGVTSAQLDLHFVAKNSHLLHIFLRGYDVFAFGPWGPTNEPAKSPETD